MQKHELKQVSTIVRQSKVENYIRLEFVEYCKEKFVADNVHLKKHIEKAMNNRTKHFAEISVSGDNFLTCFVVYLPR